MYAQMIEIFEVRLFAEFTFVVLLGMFTGAAARGGDWVRGGRASQPGSHPCLCR